MNTPRTQAATSRLRPARLIAVLAAMLLVGMPTPSAWPSQNTNGATLVQSAGEVWSGAGLVNAAGAHLDLAGAYCASVDSPNVAGAFAYLGYLGVLGGVQYSAASGHWMSKRLRSGSFRSQSQGK